MLPSNCKIVLVRPRDPNNIGAVARAMKNFGFRRLAVVTPHPPVWSEVVSAVKAGDVLTGAQVCATLDEAVAECDLVVGTTDHTRVAGRQTVYTPFDLSRDLSEAQFNLALVFGTEKHGLTNEDLSRCHRVMSIPTLPDCPSMNLGQAVAVCCYELIRDRAQQDVIPLPAETATAGATEAALQLVLEVLRQIDFVLPGNEPDLTRRLRGSLLRLKPTKYDIEMLCGILSRIKRGLAEK
ncbi:MAG TPA: RNA methyltransferase [Blastocatellia bacterium]|nr:RNA methyltransferase [Blastocatellia bacterium]HMZ22895.1 RNA methyltransferase [Blastocatellia bacterium]